MSSSSKLDPSGTSIPFAFVDVFTDAPLAGNPLAVVPYFPGLDDATFARLAREFNQSETTFLFPPTKSGADWLLRSFTPTGVEVFGAGHNAMGAWWWLASSDSTGRQSSSINSSALRCCR
jgi:PhzF family phenazine biosynthesis protein